MNYNDKTMSDRDLAKQDVLKRMIFEPNLQRMFERMRPTDCSGDMAVLTALDHKFCTPEVTSKMPLALLIFKMMLESLDVDPEEVMLAICAKHIVLASLRHGDTDLVNAYGLLEYAKDIITAELSKTSN